MLVVPSYVTAAHRLACTIHRVLPADRDANFRKMVDLLAMLKTGSCEGVKVRVGRLQNLMSSSCTGEWCDVSQPTSQADDPLFDANRFIALCLPKTRYHIDMGASDL